MYITILRPLTKILGKPRTIWNNQVYNDSKINHALTEIITWHKGLFRTDVKQFLIKLDPPIVNFLST